MSRWYVVYSQIHSEAKAQDHLRRQGYTTMLPAYRRWRLHARKRELVLRPLFPRYLFVALDMLEQRWRPILSTIGVCDLVRHGDAPVPMPRGLAEEIEQRAASGDFDAISPVQGLRRGDAVRVTDGPFADMIGRFMGAADGERVFVLLELLGRQVRTSLSQDVLAPA